MAKEAFDKNYAAIYDLLYETKDYEGECDFLEAIFRKYNKNVKTILDLGCGTGGHMRILSKRGYQVVGIERSEYMLNLGKEKMKNENIAGEMIQGDICSFNIGRQFDAVVAMFAVMGYQQTNQQLALAFKTAFNHVKPSGIFIFDGWYGPGVLADRPTRILKRIKKGNKEFLRYTDPVLDTESHTVEVKFKFWVEKDNHILSKDDESHTLRFFFPREVEYYLEVAGFKQVDFCPFMKVDQKLDESVWNMTAIGRVE